MTETLINMAVKRPKAFLKENVEKATLTDPSIG